MSGDEPVVSVLIPTRNRWALLSRALASVLAQEEVVFEVVVVDDGSTDETPARLAELDDPRIRPVMLPSNLGVARVRNVGIREARCRWVAFLDDDDIWAPTKLSEQIAAAADDVSFVYTGTYLLDEDARVKGIRLTPDPSELPGGLLETNLIGGPSVVMARTGLLREVGGFDERLAVLADWDLWLRLLEVGRAAVCFEPLAAYTVHSGSMHRMDIRLIRSELRYLRKKHREVCTRYGVRFGGDDFSQWLADGYRREGRRLDASRAYFDIGIRKRRLRDVVRAVGMLFGEQALRAGRRRVAPTPAPTPAEPSWLVAIRQRAGLEAASPAPTPR